MVHPLHAIPIPRMIMDLKIWWSNAAS
jgi:hypothetical protein